MNEVKREGKILLCTCGAKAKDTSKERGRFLRRHPYYCNLAGIQPKGAKL